MLGGTDADDVIHALDEQRRAAATSSRTSQDEPSGEPHAGEPQDLPTNCPTICPTTCRRHGRRRVRYLLNHLDSAWALTVIHLRLSLIPVLLGLLIAVPLGALVGVTRRCAGSPR